MFQFAERMMTMDDATWARHANPLSGYSRFIAGPALFLALWSPYWIGWWSVLPITAAALWTWANPRLFPPPKRTDSWATRVVLGERAFLARKTVPIPVEHARIAFIATGVSVAFMALCVLGFVRADFWLAFTGFHAAILGKLWFCDRMVWLWNDMRDAHENYRRWDRAEWAAKSEE